MLPGGSSGVAAVGAAEAEADVGSGGRGVRLVECGGRHVRRAEGGAQQLGAIGAFLVAHSDSSRWIRMARSMLRLRGWRVLEVVSRTDEICAAFRQEVEQA